MSNTLSTQFDGKLSKQLERLATAEHTAKGKLAQAVREAILAGKWYEVGQAFGNLLEAHGMRHSIGKGDNGKPVYSASTPADSMRATIHNVTSALAENRDKTGYLYGVLRPELFEDSEGNEYWGLVDKGGKVRQRGSQAKTLVKAVDKVASLCQTREEAVSALEALAAKFGLHLVVGE